MLTATSILIVIQPIAIKCSTKSNCTVKVIAWNLYHYVSKNLTMIWKGVEFDKGARWKFNLVEYEEQKRANYQRGCNKPATEKDNYLYK